MKRSRHVRRGKYEQAKACHPETGPLMENEPSVIVELRARANDASNPHPDRDRMSMICFSPTVLLRYDVCDTRIAIMQIYCSHH